MDILALNAFCLAQMIIDYMGMENVTNAMMEAEDEFTHLLGEQGRKRERRRRFC